MLSKKGTSLHAISCLLKNTMNQLEKQFFVFFVVIGNDIKMVNPEKENKHQAKGGTTTLVSLIIILCHVQTENFPIELIVFE